MFTLLKLILTDIPEFARSTIIPERLDAFINKYAEHTHDKWAFEKVRCEESTQISLF